MNARQLATLGVPPVCVPQALQVVQTIAKHNRGVPKPQRIDLEQIIQACIADPDSYRQAAPVTEAAELTAHEAALRALAEALGEPLSDRLKGGWKALTI